MSCSSFGLTALSAKIALTCSRSIVAISSSTSPAEACAWVESDGMTAPITSIP